MKEEYKDRKKRSKNAEIEGKKAKKQAELDEKNRSWHSRLGNVLGTSLLAFFIIFGGVFGYTQILDVIKNAKEDSSSKMPFDNEKTPYDKKESDPEETSLISERNYDIPYNWKESENMFMNWLGVTQINSWSLTRYIYNYWCFFVKGLFYPDLLKEEVTEETEVNDVPTAAEVTDNAKKVIDDSKKIAKAKLMKVGADKLGMRKEDMEKLSKLKNPLQARNTAINMAKKAAMKKALGGKMKGGDKANVVTAMETSDMANKAIKSIKELAIFITLPTFFLAVLTIAITAQIIPGVSIFSAFYDNNIFLGLFMMTLGFLLFGPVIGIDYTIKIIHLLLHLFVMPSLNGTGMKEFKYYANKFKYLWLILWFGIATGSVWKEFKTAGYPYNQLWMWTGGTFSFIILSWWNGLFKLL